MIPAPRLDVSPARPRRLRLPNGLTVLIEEHRGADVAAVQLWVRVGARHEGPGEGGLSHFVEHLLFKGTPTRGPGVIDRTISELGGEMNAATSQDFTYYHVVLPARHVGTAIDVMADAARRAALEAEELDRERLVVLEEIRRARDHPPSELWRLLAARHFAGHPYAEPVLGPPETIRGAPRAAVLAYFGRHYAPDNAVLVVAGNVEAERIQALVEQAFEGWAPSLAPGDGTGPAAGPATIARVEEERPLRQTYVALAWRGPTPPAPDVYAVDLLVSVLGRGRASRLCQALRERRRLVSSVGASFYTQRDAGTIMVTARTTPRQRREIEGAVLVELERLSSELVGTDEMARALTAVEAGHAFERETAEGVAYAYGAAETVWTLDFELTYLDEVRKVTREAVREAARRYLAPERFTVAALGPDHDGA